ncbi:ATP-binding protein [Flavobacterium qiangtangense]|uniref:histidine kinase n=1 Tax=Flavobacterium qiangtangense TaxID=1442595 RepID=A0ABW1PMQ3_9FLAO
MKLKEFFTPTLVYRMALGVSFVLVIGVAIVFHLQMSSLNTSVDLISESNKRQFELEKISSEIIQRENSLRSFIITKDSTFLENDLEIKRNIFKSLSSIKEQISENSNEVDAIETLTDLIQKRFANFDETLKLAETEDVNAKILNNKLVEGSAKTKVLREIIYSLINKEVNKLKIHNINHRYDIETSTITAFSLTIIVLVVLLFSLSKVNLDYQKAKKLNKELNFATQIADNAEKVAGISHWKINLKTGRYFYSDNFFRILGLEPISDNIEPDHFVKYIHPEDIDEIMKIHEESMKDLTPTSFIYRIIRPNGEIRYINSTGDFTNNAKGELVKIGVSNDITEEYTSKLALEEKNKSLIAINAELESFNQIVSHDLQEPLRKIQMFISRIQDTEWETISEKGKDYFGKIRISANRMQNLMMDLVNYSRTIKDNKVFVKTNLKEVLADVIQELSVNIEEKHAKVKVESLPKINIIQFQIHQLFVNLISNSLKYSKEDVAPLIKISTGKIEAEEKFRDIVLSDKKYHKIIVSDNGIGFKQEFSEKIFQLFKRLETEMDYAGTGLGLAICKKIIENHNGFIKADGIPGTGAIFTIYLPK